MSLNNPISRTSFTPRQAEIVNLIASGMADKEIARRLGISVSTIRTHLQRLYREIGARNRAHAVAEWLENGAARALP